MGEVNPGYTASCGGLCAVTVSEPSIRRWSEANDAKVLVRKYENNKKLPSLSFSEHSTEINVVLIDHNLQVIWSIIASLGAFSCPRGIVLCLKGMPKYC